jgi:hypothetical protein
MIVEIPYRHTQINPKDPETLHKDCAMTVKDQENPVYELSDSLLETPKVPINALIQEAEDLFHWAMQDREMLLTAGITSHTLEQMHALALILCEAQGAWNCARKTQSDARKNAIEASRKAFQFRARLVHDLLYAYRELPDARAALREIAQGNGYTDIIQDLMNLKTIGASYPQPLEKINFDFTRLEKAAFMAEGLGTLLAVANANDSSASSSKTTRDTTYARLKTVMTEVRLAGKYLFYQNAQRRLGYRSDYFRKLNSNRRPKERINAFEYKQVSIAA